MRRRRRSRNYRNSRRSNNTKLNFTPVLVLLCLSVACGYAAAKYVVQPAVNYVPQLTAEEGKTQGITADEDDGADKQKEETEVQVKNTDVVEDDVTVEEKGKIAGYALQFGCYSSKAAAETAMESVGIEGLQILEQNNMYKIIGKTYDTKEKAAAALKKLPDSAMAFVTAIYK